MEAIKKKRAWSAPGSGRWVWRERCWNDDNKSHHLLGTCPMLAAEQACPTANFFFIYNYFKGRSYSPHSTEEETKTQSDSGTLPRSQS